MRPMPYPDAMRAAMTQRQRGFTLIEAIMVITITGILAGVVAIFIRTPVQSYFDVERRAEMTDTVDTALRRIGRDVRLALPNSVRVTKVGTVSYLEFLQTSDGGRYRADGPGDILDFTATDTTFDVLGPPVAMVAGAQNLLVVYNLGIPGADAYQGDNTSPITAIDAATHIVTINAKQFPLSSPGNRFQIISSPVTYACDPGTGNLTRFWNYPIQGAQPTAFAGTPQALLATNVAGCTFTYDQLVINQRTSVVSIWLQLSQGSENVNLYHEVHVSNVP
ncbi:MAG: type II secretion system protein [Glaciimonas sp.]|nr:type II secretion system protein [Glaciimonas sp.]